MSRALVAGVLLLTLAAPVVAQDEVTFDLNEVNDSGVSGVAMLTAAGDQTDVAIRLTGATGDHPNHIHENACANVNPEPLFPLTHIVVGGADPDGFTRSTVDVPLDELLAGDYSILVHLSDDQLDEYLACGNIGEVAIASEPSAAEDIAATAEEAPAGAAAATVNEVTATGVGSAAQGDIRLSIIVAALAGFSAAIAVGVARRTRFG